MTDDELAELRRRLTDRTETLAEALLGKPNRPLSGPREIRFGRKGAIAVELAPPKRGLWHDHSADEGGDLLALIQRENRLDFPGALAWARTWLGDPERVAVPSRPAPAHVPDERAWDTVSPWGRDLWASAQPISADCPAGRYLTGRGCAIPEAHCVRWVPSLKYGPSGTEYPALLSLVTDAVTGEPINLHRTWLAADGSGKAPVDRPRLLLKGHRKAGGVIRLSADDEVTLGLGIGEGLETCLTIVASGWCPVWCAIDSGNLGSLPVLNGIEALTVFADHDFPNPKTGKRAGIEAAQKCARRWSDAGREARVIVPPVEGDDCNDWLRSTDHA